MLRKREPFPLVARLDASVWSRTSLEVVKQPLFVPSSRPAPALSKLQEWLAIDLRLQMPIPIGLTSEEPSDVGTLRSLAEYELQVLLDAIRRSDVRVLWKAHKVVRLTLRITVPRSLRLRCMR